MISSLVLTPFLGLIAINLIFRRTARPALIFASVFFLAEMIFSVWRPAWFWISDPEFLSGGSALGLAADGLTRVLLASIGLVMFTALWTGWHGFRDEGLKSNFINLLLVAAVGMNAIVMAADFFSLYLFIEVTAIASFIMIAIAKDPLGLEGAFKYLILSALATIFMLSAVALFLYVSGGTSFDAVGAAMEAHSGSFLMRLAAGLFLCGLFIKSGLVPFHGWMPDAYTAAPAPVSVFLAGIATKAAGVYVLLRVVISVFGDWDFILNPLMAIGALSIVVGALAAIKQNDFKRMLAYSSISQVGYIILALGCATPLALAGAMFHFFNHAVFKSLLFVNAAGVEEGTGTRAMDRMGGLAARMPTTGVTSLVAFLSTAGIPPLAGFWSKFMIVLALWMSGHYGYATLALLASILTSVYFLAMQRRVFFGKVPAEMSQVQRTPRVLACLEIVLAAITVGVGLCFPWAINGFIRTVLWTR